MTAAIYARVSTGDQRDSLDQQLERLRKVSPNAEEFIDVESGTKSDRDAWKRLMKACQAGTLTRVTVTRLDRVSRSRVHGAQVLQYFMRPDAPRLEALDDSLDLSTPGGRFMAGLLINWSAAESERLGERTAHGHARRRELGKPFGHRAPFGYRWNKKRDNYEICPDYGPVARKVLARALEGDLSARLLVKYAYEECSYRFGSHTALKRWMLNPSLAGMRVYGKSTVSVLEDGSKKRIHRPVGQYEEVLPNMHAPLIGEVEHARLLAIYAMPVERAVAPLQKGHTRVVTGMGVCGHCGGKLTTHMAGTKRWYRCGRDICPERYRNRIREEELREACLDGLRLASDKVAAAMLEHMSRDEDESPAVIELRGKIATLRATGLNEVKATIAELERQLKTQLQREATRRDGGLVDPRGLAQLIATPRALEHVKDEALRELFLEYLDGVVVLNGEVTETRLK